MTIAALIAAVSVTTYACDKSGPGAATGGVGGVSGSGAGDPSGGGTGGEGDWECDGEPGYDACLERSMLREAAIEELRELDEADDRRTVPVAIEALATKDPLLARVGLRILGPFAKEPGVGEAVLPYVLSSRAALQRLAADILKRTENYERIGRQWDQGHGDAPTMTAYDRDPPRDPKTWGFAAVPGGTPYPPGDGTSSLGYVTAASVDEVVAAYAKEPGSRTMTAQELAAMASKSMEDVGAKVRAIQVEYERTRDPKVLEKMKDLMAASSSAMLLVGQMPMPEGEVAGTGKAVMADVKAAGPARVAFAYREPLLGRTVVLLGWDPAVHPAPVPRARSRS